MGYILIILTFLAFSTANIINDDNYVLFSHDVKGSTSIPTKDGSLYLIAHKISKVNLETRVAELVKFVTYLDGYPVYLERGILSEDGTWLVVTPGGMSGGPNCTFHLVFDASTLDLLNQNCIGHMGDNIFRPLENDILFYPGSSDTILIGGSYENFIGGLWTLYILKAKIDSLGKMTVEYNYRSKSSITPNS